MVTLLIVLGLLNLVSSQPDCTKISDVNGSGKLYNLGALIGKEFKWSDAFSSYKATICKNEYHDCGNCGGPAGFCQYTGTWADCIGTISNAFGLAGEMGVHLLYDNGDWGNIGSIKIICDPNVEFSNITIIQNYKNIQIYSKYACLNLPPPQSDCSRIPDTAGSGAIYDLSPILGHQLFWAEPSKNYNYKASICASTYTDCGKCEGAGMCQYNNQFNDCVGRFNVALGIQDEQGVYLFYEDGDFGSEGRIKLVCDPTVVVSTPTYDENPNYITVRSKHACLCSMVCVPPY